MNTILFLDGRNFIGKLEDVFESEKQEHPEWHTYDFKGLLAHVLAGIEIDDYRFYLAKLKVHERTQEKSKKLIEKRRLLKTHLENQDFNVIVAGAVRGNIITDARGKEVLVFKEKGVDVSIAVDIVTFAFDKTLKTVVLGSSDSDLQPAIKVLNNRGVEPIYLGFELLPNKGLTATTKRTILIRNSEVLQFKTSALI